MLTQRIYKETHDRGGLTEESEIVVPMVARHLLSERVHLIYL